MLPCLEQSLFPIAVWIYRDLTSPNWKDHVFSIDSAIVSCLFAPFSLSCSTLTAFTQLDVLSQGIAQVWHSVNINWMSTSRNHTVTNSTACFAFIGCCYNEMVPNSTHSSMFICHLINAILYLAWSMSLIDHVKYNMAP